MLVTSDQSSTQPTEGLISADPAISASSNVVENDDNMNKDSKVADDSVSKARSARDVVTPLAHMPYSDQLEHKKSSLVQILKRLVRFVPLTNSYTAVQFYIYCLFSGIAFINRFHIGEESNCYDC